jgi:hypothetical protein
MSLGRRQRLVRTRDVGREFDKSPEEMENITVFLAWLWLKNIWQSKTAKADNVRSFRKILICQRYIYNYDILVTSQLLQKTIT